MKTKKSNRKPLLLDKVTASLPQIIPRRFHGAGACVAVLSPHRARSLPFAHCRASGDMKNIFRCDIIHFSCARKSMSRLSPAGPARKKSCHSSAQLAQPNKNYVTAPKPGRHHASCISGSIRSAYLSSLS